MAEKTLKETASINDRNIATKRLKEMFFTNEDSQDRISIKRAERISKREDLGNRNDCADDEESFVMTINNLAQKQFYYLRY